MTRLVKSTGKTTAAAARRTGTAIARTAKQVTSRLRPKKERPTDEGNVTAQPRATVKTKTGRATARPVDPRIGTHGRSYEPAERVTRTSNK